MFVITDYDGVVIDSFPAVRGAVAAVHSKLGLSAPTDAEVHAWAGPSIEASAERMRNLLGLSHVGQLEVQDTYFDTMIRLSPALIKAYDEMLLLIDAVNSQGIPVALATMKSRLEMDAMATPLPGLDRFAIIEAPASYIESTNKTELVRNAKDCILQDASVTGPGYMVGDRGSDMEAGVSNGLVTIGVTWGSGSRSELVAAGAQHIVTTASEAARIMGIDVPGLYLDLDARPTEAIVHDR